MSQSIHQDPKRVPLEINQDRQQANQNSAATSKFKNTTDEANPSFKSTLDKINLISRASFLYVFRIMLLGRRVEKNNEPLKDKDLVSFEYSNRGEVLESKFMKHIQDQKKRNPTKRPNTALAILMSVKWTFLLAVLVQTLFGFLRIFSGWVMKRLIECYLDPELATTDSFWWAAIIAGVMLVALFFEHHWFHIISYLSIYVRGGIVSMLYSKITRLSIPTITKLSAGKLVNLATNDVNIFEMIGFFLPSFISGWFIIIAAAALLWIYFGVTCLIGIGYMVAIIPIQAMVAFISVKPRMDRNEVTDERIRRTSEAIEGIRLLKMYTWETKFHNIITDLRKKDLKLTKRVLFWGEIVARSLSWSSNAVAAFLMFMLYNVTGGELNVAEVFSAYFVLGFVRLYFVFLTSHSFTFISEVRLLFQRLDEVMEAPEMDNIAFEEPKDSKNAVEFDNFTAYWASDAPSDSTPKATATPSNKPYELQRFKTSNPKATLADINLHLKKGSLNAVVGTVGASKTSLLLSLTGEIPETTGHLRYKGKIAYVEQEPTIFAGTVKDSILFGREYNEEFYQKVIKACNLESDLKLFPNGDMSMIGERGNNLSGGQKARLALARAVYSDADIYLLDDPLSAVDAKVAKSIFNETILGLLKEKTVILVTHQVHFVKDVENIIVLEGGRIAGKGRFEDLRKQGVDVDKIFSIQKDLNQISVTTTHTHTTTTVAVENVKVESQKEQTNFQTQREANTTEDNQDQSEEENPLAHASDVDPYNAYANLSTYWQLIKDVGLLTFFGIILAYIFVQFGEIGFGRILAAWAAGEFDLGTSLGTLGGLALYSLFIAVVKNAAFSMGFLGASKRYHEKILDNVINSPVTFFDTNPVGRVLARFSADLGVTDRFVPHVGLDVFDIFATAIAVFLTLVIVEPIILAPMAGVIILGLIIVVLYYPSMKQTKFYELGTRGNLFSLYSATIPGMAVIRTYGQVDNFRNKFTSLLHTNTKGNFNFILASRLLCFSVDWVYNLIAIGMIYIVTARIDTSQGPTGGAVAAFTLVLVLSLNGIFQHGVRQFCQTNILMACVARLQAYCGLPSEAPRSLSTDDELKQKGWPQKGNIDFSQVYMKYRPDTDFVIKNLDLHANSGEKIGCVGRTGAGKSTIINLLFRLQEIDKTGDHKDAYIKLDNTNTQPLGLHLLRENISIIPQTPFIFTGTVRQNLDPLNQFSDDQIWKVLEEVRLKDQISRLSNKLNTEIHNASAIFSVGQKQLVCLARAILKPSKVLVLDEATANMDTETDHFIQQKVMEKFKDSTVFTIAHRLATIADYDKVLVLDKGQKVEFDAPYKLLVKNVGDETVTNPEGQFGSMVMNTGPIASQRILNIAKQAYQRKSKDDTKAHVQAHF